jgi:uncharacterized protein
VSADGPGRDAPPSPSAGGAGNRDGDRPAIDVNAAVDALVRALDAHHRIAIAVSGGVDSMTLAHVAQRRSRTIATMVHACGPAVPAAARERVERHASAYGWSLRLLDAGELDDQRYRANPVDRCYYCKTNLYDRIREQVGGRIASGTNLDDLDDFRPGLRAAGERGVVHPYVEAGIDKRTVYAIAAALGLQDLERLPAQPCLASRVETGIAIARDDLAFIDRVEARLAQVLGAETVLRCRITHAGVVVELDALAPEAIASARSIAQDACMRSLRTFAGVRAYRRGAAFLVGAADD